MLPLAPEPVLLYDPIIVTGIPVFVALIVVPFDSYHKDAVPPILPVKEPIWVSFNDT